MDVSDALGNGLVTNLAHPGGNITGNTQMSPDLVGKQIEIMKEVIPALRRIALLNLPTSQPNVVLTTLASDAAKALGIEPVVVDFIQGDDFETQFDRVVATGAQAVYGQLAPISWPIKTYCSIFRSKPNFLSSSPAIYDPPVVTPFVGVISYGPKITVIFRRAAAFFDAILKGAKAGDLPVEQPTVFDLAVNLDAAKKIGITIPPDILAQATLVIDYDIRAPQPGAAK